MKIKLFLVLALFGFLAFAVGCGTPFVELSDNVGYSDSELQDPTNDSDYALAYNAMRQVLEEEFGRNLIEHNKYPGQQYRRMLVYSRVNAEGGTKTRTKIEAFVGRDEYNQITPVFYCWYQIEKMPTRRDLNPTAVPAVFGADYPQKRFINAARNERLEAYLLNKTFDKLRGKNRFSGRYSVYAPANKPWIVYKPSRFKLPNETTSKPSATEPATKPETTPATKPATVPTTKPETNTKPK